LVRYTIIDHSTLSATLRLLGGIPVSPDYDADGDIAAFEGLLRAILFYDEIFIIDDYKPKFREERARFFPFVKTLTSAHIDYGRYLSNARDLTSDIALRTRGDKVTESTIVEFLKALDLRATFWTHNPGSDWYLAMMMLVGSGTCAAEADKYGTLMEMLLFDQDMERNRSEHRVVGLENRASFADSDGFKLDASESKQLLEFAAQFSWLSLRSAFYTLIASNNGIDATLHPIRSAFVGVLAKSKFALPPNVYSAVLNRLSTAGEATVRAIREYTDPILVEQTLPLFALYLAAHVDDPRRYLDGAFDLRTKPSFVEARQQLIALEDARNGGDQAGFVRRANRLVSDIEKLSADMKQRYGVEMTQDVSPSPIISVINSILAFTGPGLRLPDPGIKIPIAGRMLDRRNRAGFRGVFRSVVRDLSAIACLGEFHERLTSAVDRSFWRNERHNGHIRKKPGW
jgi:hypothetical protein